MVASYSWKGVLEVNGSNSCTLQFWNVPLSECAFKERRLMERLLKPLEWRKSYRDWEAERESQWVDIRLDKSDKNLSVNCARSQIKRSRQSESTILSDGVQLNCHWYVIDCELSESFFLRINKVFKSWNNAFKKAEKSTLSSTGKVQLC